MTGIYLECGACGATLGGEEVSAEYNGVHWSRSHELTEAALELGWTGPLTRESSTDKCPACSEKNA